MTSLPTICSFWHGELGWLGQLSIASFIAQGHPFHLYVYDDPGPVPAGCVVRDAASIVPRDQMFFYKGSRTPAVFADYFRLRLMAERAGIWADCDVYCVRPLVGLGDYVFGIEGRAGLLQRPVINNAVFSCPADSALLESLLAVFAPGAIPPGMPFYRLWEVRLRRAVGQDLPVSHMQFGATGPWPLNHHVRRLGLFGVAQPQDVFYPIGWGRSAVLLAPGSTIGSVITARTLAVHLWHSALTDRGSGTLSRPAAGSFFATACQQFGIAF